MTSYVTFSIANNSQENGTASGLADDAIYLFFTQESLNQAWSMDPATGIATPMPAPGTLAPAFTLADLKKAGGAIQLDAGVQAPSARLYFSSSPDAVTAPNNKISGPTPSTADFFYDFVEVSLTAPSNAPAGTAPDNLNLDCTQVDQLGIPYTLQVTPHDPSFGAGSGIVATLDRQTLVANYKAMAVGPLAPFADCVYPEGSDASTPYRLLNPNDLISAELLTTSSLQGTLAVSGAPGAWQAVFTITGPGTPAPTNGGLVVGMPVSGPMMPAGATVGSLPGSPSGNSVVIASASSAANNPFTASTSPVELFFVTPPTTALASWFDAAIDNFFAWCKKNPGLLQIEQNNNGNHLYTGNVVQVGGIIDINGNSNTYTVLQFTGGNGESYNLYYPFFSTNSAAGKTTPFGADVPPPPAWWTPLKGLMYYQPPSAMVFGASGVFADNTQQPLTAPNSSAVLGAIENAVVTALGRGYATTWKFLQGGITPGNPATTATVSLSGGATTAGLVDGMDMASFQIASIPMMASIPAGAPVSSFSVSSPQAILPTTPDLLTFSQFYPAGGTWSAFANFLHNPAVTVGGRAYALPYDDQGGFSSDLNAATSVASPASVQVTLGPWAPGSVTPAVLEGNTNQLVWQASDNYCFTFLLCYDTSGVYTTMDITIQGGQFSGGGYTPPVTLQSATETIDMKLVAVGKPYSWGLWCDIHLPGAEPEQDFHFEGVAFEFSTQYNDPQPYTVWD